MFAHTGRLLLSAQDPLLLPDPSLLTARLAAADFLGDPLPGYDGAFVVGKRFLQLVTFAGCSVRIELSPNGDTPFCHVRITGPFAKPMFLHGRNTRPPRCPACRSPLRNWKQLLRGWDETKVARITCSDCGETSPPWTYDWKEKAGFGRLFVQVEEVFPGEGTPTPGLMELLEGSTGCPWRYFYIQNA